MRGFTNGIGRTTQALALGCALLLAPHVQAQQPAQQPTIPADAVLLRLEVVDPAGKPLPGVQVQLGSEVIGVTDEQGLFYLPKKPTTPGSYRLTVSLLGYKTRFRPVSIPDETLVRIEMERQPPPVQGKVSGKLSPNYTLEQLFYATDRQRETTQDPEEFYGATRASGGKVELGVCEISIPGTHAVGEIESPSYIRLEFKFDPEKHVVLHKPEPLESGPFFQKLAAAVGASKNKEAFVFIHGYNTRFADAAKRAAQLAYDLKFDGAPIVYSWPSRGAYSGYFADEDTVEWTVPHLRAFLEQIAAQSGAARVHLIAHSMGNRALTRALQTIASDDTGPGRPHFQQIVLAAPDIKVNLMKPLAEAMVPLGRKVTLYASRNDDALILARILDGVARAGEQIREALMPGIDAVDASAVRTDLIGHGYFAQSPSIISDIRKLLLDESPDVRKLVPMKVAQWRYWIIPGTTAH